MTGQFTTAKTSNCSNVSSSSSRAEKACGWDGGHPGLTMWNLLRKCAKCARKLLYFYYVAAICAPTGGTEQIRACVGRYDQSAWTANKGRQNRVHDGALPPCLLKGGGNGTRVPLHNSIIRYFMIYQDDLKQIYCSYSRTQNSEWISIISVIFLRSTLLLNI